MNAHLSLTESAEFVKGNLSLPIARSYFEHIRACCRCWESISAFFPETPFGKVTSSPPKLWWATIAVDIELGIIVSATEIWAVTMSRTELERLVKLCPVECQQVEESHLPAIGQKASAACREYLATGSPLSTLPLSLSLVKSWFQRQVLFWTALIPYGETATYGEIASWLNKPGAARAVGGAQHANPLPLFIPCHRVVGRGGALVGFGGGVALKRKLLEIESKYLQFNI